MNDRMDAGLVHASVVFKLLVTQCIAKLTMALRVLTLSSIL